MTHVLSNLVPILILSASVVLQLWAAVLALLAIPYSRRYRYSWLFLSFALIIMIERRAMPLYEVMHGEAPDVPYDLFGLVISIFMAMGVAGLRRLLIALWQNEELLTHLAVTDALTGIANRSHALGKFKAEIIRAERSGSPLSVFILDIDYFKRVNDEYGHVIGDEVLMGVTARCAGLLRAIDIFGRLGGEEFLVVMPDTDTNAAAVAAERLRAACANEPIETSQKPFAITISIGVTTYTPSSLTGENFGVAHPDSSVKTLLQRADQALYQAKAKGRNCVREWR